ncbi:MAG: DUF371 domain-containing protein [Acidilobaceae archaeon]|nr:DUF371 domain-containing protein [Acidilobaceae archaeon]
MRLLELRAITFKARGHPNVRATHRSTLEITKEEHLTPKGDCIVGVSAELSPADLPRELKEAMAGEALIIAVLCVRNICDVVTGRGSPRLELSDERKMVFRKSSYVGPETVMIGADKAAKDLKRELIDLLSRGEELTVTLIVLPLAYSP